jgi:translation initiation factor 6
MKFATLNFQNNPNIGLFAFATDSFCLANNFIGEKAAALIHKTLRVPVHRTRMLGTGLIGIFAAGNAKGIVISDRIHHEEIAQIKKKCDVLVLETKHTAMGNLILANDRGCIISKELEGLGQDIEAFLGVETKVGTIAGMDLVGSLAIANSKGCLIHKAATTKEKELIGKTLDVAVLPGSVNFGNQWIRSGLIANSHGFVSGDRTSGPELGLVAETLGFV